MTRRPTGALLAAIGGAGLLAATMVTSTLAQSPSAPAKTPYPAPTEKPPAPSADATQYPAYGGGVDCDAGTFNGLPYAGNLKSIDAPDPMTVKFTFCKPDVAFLSQIAFNSLAINDTDYLIAHVPDKSILIKPNGTGPYMRTLWDRGNRLDFEANPTYWGTPPLSPNLEFQWGATSADRLVALNAGTVDGIDNPGKDDLDAINSDPNLKFYPRDGINVSFIGFNVDNPPFTNEKVRQAIAMGIDRKRIVDNFYPPGSEVAEFFVPCAIPNACGGDPYYEFDPDAAKKLLAEGLAELGLPTDGFKTTLSFRAAVRGYNPDPPTIAVEIQSQLKQNLNIDAAIDLQESGPFLANFTGGKLPGISMVGWGADYPDPSNFLDNHFGPGGQLRFGTPFKDLVEAIKQGTQSAVDADRLKAYTTANNLLKKYVPAVFIAHGGSGTAFKADVAGGYADALQEKFKGMKAGDRDTLVWMQNAEPISLYCADETDGETLRACNQISESLYGYGGETGLEPVPALATGCTPNDDLTVWTCALRPGVKFQDGSDFAADDVITSFAAQWDNLSPLHIASTGQFAYWDGLIGGGKLNPPAPCGLPNSNPCPRS